ncbi:hypothetical protein [Streptomyces collinus]|uniref:hypothetical protein n=1 Tax=Streptomyces collinus TaxID=42684 RepID=UPI00294224D0|nr:hypothetical protein [Streptomyces collinus]
MRDTGRRRSVRLQALSGHNFRITVGDRHIAHAPAQLVGHRGWLCWPTRWRDIAGTDKERLVSAAFVSDSGHVVWGTTRKDDYAYSLRAGAAPVCPTETSLSAAPLPAPSRYVPGKHAPRLLVASAGALLCVPHVLGVVPHWAGMLLAVPSGAMGLVAGMLMGGSGVDPDLWTTRTTSRPSLRQTRPAPTPAPKGVDQPSGKDDSPTLAQARPDARRRVPMPRHAATARGTAVTESERTPHNVVPLRKTVSPY